MALILILPQVTSEAPVPLHRTHDHLNATPVSVRGSRISNGIGLRWVTRADVPPPGWRSRAEKACIRSPARSRTIGAVRASFSRKSGSQWTLCRLKQDSNSHFLGRGDDQSMLAGVQK